MPHGSCHDSWGPVLLYTRQSTVATSSRNSYSVGRHCETALRIPSKASPPLRLFPPSPRCGPAITLCYVMCVLPDRLPAWGPFPSSVRLFSARPLIKTGISQVGLARSVAAGRVIAKRASGSLYYCSTHYLEVASRSPSSSSRGECLETSGIPYLYLVFTVGVPTLYLVTSLYQYLARKFLASISRYERVRFVRGPVLACPRSRTLQE
jgi:hypothetical protein